MIIRKRAFLLVAILGVVLTNWNPSSAQSADSKCFEETGHCISGPFLDRYNAADDPLLLFGYPITEMIQDPLTQRPVQYFQRARMELDTSAPEGSQVTLTPLGTNNYTPGDPLAYATDSPTCEFFPATSKHVCYGFLTFYHKNGGAEFFGQPISEAELRDNRYVQYFEYARLEWHPELPNGKAITLANLGQIDFDRWGLDQRLLDPVVSAAIPQSLIHMNARAFVAKAVIKPGADQTLYVIVQDQMLQPVSQALVTADMKDPSGAVNRVTLSPTDENGITTLKFSASTSNADQVVQISVTATARGQSSTTRTWYRLWW